MSDARDSLIKAMEEAGYQHEVREAWQLEGLPTGRLPEWFGPQAERWVYPTGEIQRDADGFESPTYDVFLKGVRPRGDNRKERALRQKQYASDGWSCTTRYLPEGEYPSLPKDGRQFAIPTTERVGVGESTKRAWDVYARSSSVEGAPDSNPADWQATG